MRSNIRLIHLWHLLHSLNPGNSLYVLYLTQVTGSATLGMSLVGLEQLSQAICEVPTGILSDKVGRKRTFVLMTFVFLVAGITYAFTRSFWWLALGASVMGLARSLASGSIDAYVYETLRDNGNEDQFGKWVAKLEGTWQTGMIFSSLFGIVCVYYFGLQMLMIIGIFPQAACVVMSFWLTNPKTHKKDESLSILQHLGSSLRLIWSDIRLRTLTITNIIQDTIGDGAYSFRNIFIATLWPLWAINFAVVANKILGAFGFFFAHKYIKRVGPLDSIIQSVVFSRTARIVATVYPTFFSPLIIQAGQITYGVEFVAKKKIQQEYFSDTKRATMGSIEAFGTALLMSIIVPLIGILSDATSPATALLVCYIFQLSGGFGYVFLSKMLKPRNSSSAT